MVKHMNAYVCRYIYIYRHIDTYTYTIYNIQYTIYNIQYTIYNIHTYRHSGRVVIPVRIICIDICIYIDMYRDIQIYRYIIYLV